MKEVGRYKTINSLGLLSLTVKDPDGCGDAPSESSNPA